jgi:hypothetical protein
MVVLNDKKGLENITHYYALTAQCAVQVRVSTVNQAGGCPFGSAIELDDSADIEAILELLPHIGSHTIAECEASFVVPVVGRWWGVDEIATHLTDVMDAVRFGLADPAHEVPG